MKYIKLFLLWFIFSPAFFFYCKKYDVGVSRSRRWLLTIFSPLFIVILPLVLLCLILVSAFSPQSGDYPSNDAPSIITGIDFPKLNPIDSSSNRMLAFTNVSKTYLPETKLFDEIYNELDKKCKTDPTHWKKKKNSYVYDDLYSTEIIIQRPHIGDTITIKETKDNGNDNYLY